MEEGINDVIWIVVAINYVFVPAEVCFLVYIYSIKVKQSQLISGNYCRL